MKKSVIKLGSKGELVRYLQEILKSLGHLELVIDGDFGKRTELAVKDFQKLNNLGVDGIVGSKTWELLEKNSLSITEADYKRAANELGVEVAVIKAVKEVETGGRGGFLSPGRPVILFEGHIFWKELVKRNIDPLQYARGNEEILYQKWTKSHYLGGTKEYYRLERAINIDRDSALCSASWGLFQIMGFNYKSCGCKSIEEFVSKSKQSEGDQLDLFVEFIKSNKLEEYLREKDWAGFARKYNGPSYSENNYDEKLEKAYKKYH